MREDPAAEPLPDPFAPHLAPPPPAPPCPPDAPLTPGLDPFGLHLLDVARAT
jgi:hypothetical protein